MIFDIFPFDEVGPRAKFILNTIFSEKFNFLTHLDEVSICLLSHYHFSFFSIWFSFNT